jgi:hypothetical protein
VDHSFRRTGDNGDVQQGKKQCVFLSSAIEDQDLIAGEKGVSKDFPGGSALSTDPCAGKEVVIPPGEPVKRDDCLTLIFGGSSQAFTSETVGSSELLCGNSPAHKRVEGRWKRDDRSCAEFPGSCVSVMVSIPVNWAPLNLFHPNRNNLTVPSRHHVDHPWLGRRLIQSRSTL